jgi:hypothetical protein
MLLPDTTRVVIPQSEHDVIMMTANRKYWTDPVYRRNCNEWLRYFKSIETEPGVLEPGSSPHHTRLRYPMLRVVVRPGHDV